MKSNWLPVLLGIIIVIVLINEVISDGRNKREEDKQFAAYLASSNDSTWTAPSLYTDEATQGKEREMVIYGQDLIAHTSKYFGPRGLVAQITNGMNCQNCHLDAGTRPWGSNFGAVYATYPQFRARNNGIQSIYGRVNDCFERSLNGKAIDTNSKEMQAIFAYMKWLGRDVPKGKKPPGSSLATPRFLNRAADPARGKVVYNTICQSCHGANGEGQMNTSGTEYIYPPLWGGHSFNDGAGLYRLSSFAAFVKNNMPFNQASHTDPKLSDEEAWDVAAFVNSQPRPHKDQAGDWKKTVKKPYDFPFGPYADTFSEQQHKFGPFGPIVEASKNIPK